LENSNTVENDEAEVEETQPYSLIRGPSMVEDLKDQLLLPEYMKTVDLNFHPKASIAIKDFIHDRNNQIKSKHYVLVVTGPQGCGKSFVVEDAVKKAGYETVHIDMMKKDNMGYFKQAVVQGSDPMSNIGSNTRKRVRVVFIDAMEGLLSDTVKKMTTFISRLTNPEKHEKRNIKNRNTQRFWLNPIVVTCVTTFEKSLVPFVMGLNIKEVKCKVLQDHQRTTLVKMGCARLGVKMTPRIRQLASSSQDLTYVLNQLHFLVCSTGKLSNETRRMDSGNLDIFKCCNSIFDPPTKDSFELYNTRWDCGGDKIDTVVFNNYPNFVSVVPQPGKGCRSKKELNLALNEYSPKLLTLGLEQLDAIAEACSTQDIMVDPSNPFNTDVLDIGSRVYRTKMFETMKSRFGSKGKRRINAKTSGKNPRLDSSYKMCRIDKRMEEKLRFITEMHQCQTRKIHTQDSNLDIGSDYDLSKHIGWYMSLSTSDKDIEQLGDDFDDSKLTYTKMDMFANPDDAKTKTKTKKNGGRWCPRLKAIKLFSHVYSSFKHRSPQHFLVGDKATTN
jgi:hypothetical protein